MIKKNLPCPRLMRGRGFLSWKRCFIHRDNTPIPDVKKEYLIVKATIFCKIFIKNEVIRRRYMPSVFKFLYYSFILLECPMPVHKNELTVTCERIVDNLTDPPTGKNCSGHPHPDKQKDFE